MIMDGKSVAKKIRQDIKQEISGMKVKPGLAVVQVGDNAASNVYIRLKEKACKEVGIDLRLVKLQESVPEERLLADIEKLNDDDRIHGMLVQLPLPKHINVERVLSAVDPDKDVDGFNPVNVGLLAVGEPRFVPATPKGVMRLLDEYKIPIEGRNAVVVGRSNIVGKPLAAMLLARHATVTICHSRTKDLVEVTKRADILAVAVGRPGMIKKEHVKKGAVVVDVGITEVDGNLKGDVAFDEVEPIASHITPVPGGVGPMTIAMLLESTKEAAK